MLQMTEEVYSLILDERDRAKRVHGDRYASLHEGNGVLMEEMQEGWDEGKKLTGLQSDFTFAIRVDDKRDAKNILERIRTTAMLAACEYIQVGAVAEKMLDGLAE